MWEGFSSCSPISRYCSLWLMPHRFVQSHIGERHLPHMPYKLEPKTHVYHRMIPARFCYPWRARLYHWTILLIGTVPQKRLLIWEGFSSRFPISRYCRIVRFGSYLTHLFNLTSGRDASHMCHMCLISLSSRHMCTTIRQF